MENLDTIQNLQALIQSNPYVAAFAGITLLTIFAVFANFLVKRVLMRVILGFVRMTKYGKDQDLSRHNVISRLANIVPAIIVIAGIPFIPQMPEQLTQIIRNVSGAFIILALAMAIGEALNLANTLYMRRKDAAQKPIKGYLQVLKIGVYIVSAILVIATLIDKSPVILLSGLGAMAAVLMLVFQDTLLSLVASIQISSADMVRIGDWIEMPQLNADGDVIDISLHTVKVQNWDKTITTLPTRKLVSDPFKNWRGMQESGGRRIKRAIFIDQQSIRFLTEEEKQHLKNFNLLSAYIDEKEKELEEWNSKIPNESTRALNARRMTNIGTFRSYVLQYLKANLKIHQNMTMIVRQLASGATGLPIEIYCFTNTIAWVEYEGIQSDIFDHFYAILPEFGLRAYQQPSGADIQIAGQSLLQR